MAVATPILPADPPLARAAPFHPLAIDADRCKGCELCVTACPKACLALDAAVVNRLGHHPIRLIDEAACTSCAFCARVCPDTVFTVFARRRES